MAGIPVPIYKEQVREQGLPGVRQQASAEPWRRGVESIVQGASQVVNVGAQIYLQEMRRFDAAAVNEAQVKAGKARLALHNHLHTAKLKDAVGVSDAVVKSYRENLTNIGKTLTSESQRTAFQEWASRDDLSFMESTTSYAAQQSEAHAEQAFKSQQEMSDIQAATIAASDTEPNQRSVDIQNALVEKRSAFEKYRQTSGWDDATAQLNRVKSFTGFHSGVVQGLLDKDWRGAEKYLVQAKSTGELDPDVADKLEGEIKVVRAKSEALPLALDIVRRNTTDAKLGLPRTDLAAALVAVDTDRELIAQPEKYQMVRQAVRQMANDNDDARRGADSPRIAALDQLILTGHRLDVASPTFRALSEEGKAVVLNHARARVSEGRKEQSDLDTIRFNEFVSMPPEELMRTDPSADIRYSDSSERARSRMNVAKRQMLNKSGVNLTEMQKAIDTKATRNGWKAKGVRYNEMKGDLMNRYLDWQNQPGNAELAPPTDVVNKWVDQYELDEVEKKIPLLGIPYTTKVLRKDRPEPVPAAAVPAGTKFDHPTKITDGSRKADGSLKTFTLAAGQPFPEGFELVP